MTTETKKPPMKKSDEAKPEQLDMAREQGDAYVKALKHMASEEAEDGGEKRAGNYVVAYAVEKAEGMYELKDGHLQWREPGNKNAHVEISVRDGADNRFIPGLTITVTMEDEQGKQIGKHKQPFIWHPWLYHYGLNWRVPGDGKYTLNVHIKAPQYMRHDEKNGKRYGEDVEVTFKNVKIKTGQK